MASSASRRKLKSRLLLASPLSLSLYFQLVLGKDAVKSTDRGGGDRVKVNYVVGVNCVRAGEVVATLSRQAHFVLNACTRASFSRRRRRDLLRD